MEGKITPKSFATKYFGEGKGIEESRAFFRKLKDLGLLLEVQSTPTVTEEVKAA